MQFTTDAVQTVKVVELVMVELVSGSSKQWSLIKIQNISSTLVQPDIDIFKRKDAIIWQFYSHRFVSLYDFVENFRKAATV